MSFTQFNTAMYNEDKPDTTVFKSLSVNPPNFEIDGSGHNYSFLVNIKVTRSGVRRY